MTIVLLTAGAIVLLTAAFQVWTITAGREWYACHRQWWFRRGPRATPEQQHADIRVARLATAILLPIAAALFLLAAVH